MSDYKKTTEPITVKTFTLEELRKQGDQSAAAKNSMPVAYGSPFSLPPSPLTNTLASLVAGVATPPTTASLYGAEVSVESTSNLGKLVKDARSAMGLSQQEFADLAGVGRRFVSELENGKTSLEIGLVLQVSKAAGIDISARRRHIR